LSSLKTGVEKRSSLLWNTGDTILILATNLTEVETDWTFFKSNGKSASDRLLFQMIWHATNLPVILETVSFIYFYCASSRKRQQRRKSRRGETERALEASFFIPFLKILGAKIKNAVVNIFTEKKIELTLMLLGGVFSKGK
jgi:hypothetical protein